MRIRTTVATIVALGLLAAGCGGGGDDSSGGSAEPPVDGTFTTSVAADPGNLHPHLTTLSATRSVDTYMYDKLVYFTIDGEELPWVAESWEVTADTVTYTIKDGVTCTDGSALTASDVAANFQFIADPANESPVAGVLVPAQMEVTSDDAARTVTITVPQPDPFLLHSTGELFIACRAALDDPSTAAGAGGGTGMFELTDAAVDDHYTFTRRDDYTWGPDGATAEQAGTPKTVTLRVIPNESTAVNLFLSGDLTAVTAVGPDRERLADGDYGVEEVQGLVGEMFINQAQGRPGQDDAVRAALVQALNFEELTSVITGGFGAPASALAVIAPQVCPFDSVAGNLPEQDADAAAATLDAAGWTAGGNGIRAKDGQDLTINLIYNSTRGDATAAAAELIVSTWSELGVNATSRGMAPTEYNEVVFATGDWDAALLPINLRLPNGLVPFLSGPTPAEGGVNLASIANSEYDAKVAEAIAIPGVESCDAWMAAEQALFAERDVTAFANETIPTFLDGATVEPGSDGLVPPTIRLTGEG